MKIFGRTITISKPNDQTPPPAPMQPQVSYGFGPISHSDIGRHVSIDTAKKIATAYRCANIISDDIASMPFQQFEKIGKDIRRVEPNAAQRNIAYLIEVQPNRWMTPFIFKKTMADWLVWRGNAYVWTPPSSYREMFLLNSDMTYPVFDLDGNLWYQTLFPSGKNQIIPSVEIAHLMINPVDGIYGRGVLTFSRDTLGRQLTAYDTQNSIIKKGLNPSGFLWTSATVADQAARDKVRREYIESATDEKKGGIVIMDGNFTKFEAVTMKPLDAQFLETVAKNEVDVLNYFGMPEFKLNMGKQSYEANIQQDKNYLYTTLDSYLVQIEQVFGIKLVRLEEQGRKYFRFTREALMRMDAKSRAEYLNFKVNNGQMTPNEARQVDDMNPFEGGDSHYMQSSMGVIQKDGIILGGVTEKTTEKVVQK
jgi:HK97 family phage portal protein